MSEKKLQTKKEFDGGSPMFSRKGAILSGRI